MKLNRLLLCCILSIISSVALYSIDYREVSIVLPQEILRDLQNYKQVRFLYWVSAKEILFGEHMDSYWTAKIVDIEKGIVTQHLRFERSEHIIRIDGQRKWILTRGLNGELKTYSYNPGYYAGQGLYSERYRFEQKFIARGASQYRLTEYLDQGTVEVGGWELVSEIIPGDDEVRTTLRINGLHGYDAFIIDSENLKAILRASEGNFIATFDGLKIVRLQNYSPYIHGYTFCVESNYLLTLKLLPESGYRWGADGPSPLYPRVLDFEGNVISEFKDIIMPEGGKPIDYNGDTGQFVTLEITDNRTMAATLRVYEFLGADK